MKCEYCDMTVEGKGACPYCGAPIPEFRAVSRSTEDSTVDFGEMFNNDFFNNVNIEPGKNVSVKRESHTYVNGKEVEGSDFDTDKFMKNMKRAFKSGNVNTKVTSNNSNVNTGEVLERVEDILEGLF